MARLFSGLLDCCFMILLVAMTALCTLIVGQ
jgi:hypothetical protein